MGKTTGEQKCVYLVKHGKRLLLLGIPPKLIFVLYSFGIFVQGHQPAQSTRFYKNRVNKNGVYAKRC